MNLKAIQDVVDRIGYDKAGWAVKISQFSESMEGERAFHEEWRPYLQVHYDGSGAYGESSWTGRKWPLSEFMTETEIVHTAFKALLAAEEHETRELFTYDGVAVCGPHYAIRDLVTLVKLRKLGHDVRDDAMQGAR